MLKEAVVADKPIVDSAVHPGTEGCPKEGDDLFSPKGSVYYPTSRFALNPEEILPPPTLNLELVVDFRRNGEILGGLNFDDVMVTEDIQKDYSFEQIQQAAVEDAIQIYGTAVRLQAGDEMWVNDKLFKVLTQEDVDSVVLD